jgi:integrase
MKTRKQIVRLRNKELKDGSKSLYLDIYHNGKRRKEYLKLHLVKPKSGLDRETNKQTERLAEHIRAQRQTELQNSKYSFDDGSKLDINFLGYFESLVEKKISSKGNYSNWDGCLKHLKNYCSPETTFRDIDQDFVEGFRRHIYEVAKTKSNTLLSKNSQSSYFNKFKAALQAAFDERIVNENFSRKVKGITPEETHREYLTIDELRSLKKADCKNPVMKTAFLFSCLTGIRYSDIHKMKWSEVQKQEDSYRVVFRQQKTKGQEYLDITAQAQKLLGEAGSPEERVFTGLKYSSWNNLELQRWVMRAGITKTITFHCGRHTFAIMLLERGVDIFTVSKLLGHKDLKTTQVYAKILDEKKREAVKRIPDIEI